MYFNRNSVTNIKFVNSFTPGDNPAGILVPNDEIAESGLARHAVGDDFYVRTTNPACFHLNKDFIGPRRGHLALFNPHIIEGMQNGRSHFLGYIHNHFLPCPVTGA
jgi:hypothetical protein